MKEEGQVAREVGSGAIGGEVHMRGRKDEGRGMRICKGVSKQCRQVMHNALGLANQNQVKQPE
jgi:hypothetical protein